ncbi:hypothetical protein V8F06_012416 [Rhypophila decipiens]
MEINNQDQSRFAARWLKFDEYPLTILRTDILSHCLKLLQAGLGKDDLFHATYRSLHIRDLRDEADEFDQTAKPMDVKDLRAALTRHTLDPWARYIFLLSQTSRGYLACSREQLAMILTYHQVTPSFLELVFTCRYRELPLDYALFRNENFLEASDAILDLPTMGRSGYQLQHAFNLLTVERADDPNEKQQWPLRHASLYHSLDIKTGRSLYMLLKGNIKLAQRIKDVTETHRHLCASASRTCEQAFVGSLRIHLIMLEWCLENWNEYIEHMDEIIRSRSVEAKVAPVTDVTNDLATTFSRRGTGFSRRGTIQTMGSRQGTFRAMGSRKSTTSRQKSQPKAALQETIQPAVTLTNPVNTEPPSPMSLRRTGSQMVTGFIRRLSGLQSRHRVQQAESVDEEPNEGIQRLAALESQFTFRNLQRLSLNGDEIDRSLSAFEQNLGVINQIEEEYKDLPESYAFKEFLKKDKYERDLAIFLRRIRGIRQELELRRQRLYNLSHIVEKDKQMFESLNQYTTIQTSKAFQKLAQTSTNEMMEWTAEMHEIALKTKQETLSMHVITVFTLIFLPGTFIATFFGSGVLRWDEDGTLGSDRVVRGEGIRLFLAISLPMMVIIISGWTALYLAAKRWARRHQEKMRRQSSERRHGSMFSAGPDAHHHSRESRWLDRRAAPPWRPVTMTATANPEPFVHFTEFIAETRNKYKGHDIAGNEHQYVPWSELAQYWTPTRIRRVLYAFESRIDVDVNVIREHYLRIFSTLAYTGPQAVRSFNIIFVRHDLRDEKFPLRARPDIWPDGKFFNDIFNEISPVQWQFFPLDFTHHHVQDCHIDDKCILPIDAPQPISHGTFATVERITIHDEYNNLVPGNRDGHPTVRDFVVKTYDNKKYEDQYENELKAYLRLKPTSSPIPNLVKFFGCFRQLDSYSLLLEYVDGGNLGEFFASTPPPATREDTAEFWSNLLQVLNGLDRIHQQMDYDDEVIRGIHEDIRPENILLMKGPSGSPYDFVPKLADFGLYSRVRTAKRPASGGVGLDQSGSQRYSAPECSRHTIQRGRAINMITTSSDIFAFGAVLSHTAAWVVGGPGEQLSYLKARMAYHEAQVSRFKGSGYEGCFHDSNAPIPVITQHHRKFKELCQRSDTMTPLVLDLVEQHMLLEQTKTRIRAGDALEKFIMQTQSPLSASTSTETPRSPTSSSPPWSPQVNLQSTQDKNGSTTTITPTVESDPPLPDTTTQSTSNPTSSISSVADRVGIKDILGFRSNQREGKPVDPATAALVDYLEYNLIGRDQLFFIDDSSSMFENKEVIGDAFTALACIAKRLDPNQVELVFASKPRKVHKARRTTRLRELVNKCEYKGEGSLMASRMAELVEHVLIKHLPWRPAGFNLNPLARKKTSVYVFTDGNWGEVHPKRNDACGVQLQVQRLIKEMQRRNLDPSQVTLHFIRFGDKENGRVRLQSLDDFGRKKYGNWDIVDVKHIKDSMKGIMMGPLTPAVCDEPEYFDV